jgi:hypothetical protein
MALSPVPAQESLAPVSNGKGMARRKGVGNSTRALPAKPRSKAHGLWASEERGEGADGGGQRACPARQAAGFIAEARPREGRNNGRKGGERERERDKLGEEKPNKGSEEEMALRPAQKKARRGKFLATRGATSSPTTAIDDAAAASCGALSFRLDRRRKVHRILAGAVGPRPCPLFSGDGAPAGPRESRCGVAGGGGCQRGGCGLWTCG